MIRSEPLHDRLVPSHQLPVGIRPKRRTDMKRIAGVVVALGMVLVAGVAVAHGPEYYDGPGTGAVKKFQKETLSLRDELVTKQMDLEAEYQKAEPDTARIAALRKEIVDLEAKIQVVGDKVGVRTWGRGHDRGMMYRDAGWDGCGCGHCW
jgi:hypothetical protein